MEDLKELLKNYGTVDQCEVVDDLLHIKLTGFENNAVQSFNLLRLIAETTGYTTVRKIEIDKGIFHLILV